MGETIEDIILRHSGRGMLRLRPYVQPDYCRAAARAMLSLKRGTVLLLTGFYVHHKAETDGPAGTFAVAQALRRLGFTPVIVTDTYCLHIFEPYGFETVYFPFDGTEKEADALLERYRPVCLFSLERCGRNRDGRYTNMRGEDIGAYTAPLDWLFLRAEGKLPTFAVGDGGNEIGMGTLSEAIEEKLSLTPCAVRADYILIATVSNWGGYGFCAAMEQLTGEPVTPTFAQIHTFMVHASVAADCIDGVTRFYTLTEDGFSAGITEEILGALLEASGRKELRA